MKNDLVLSGVIEMLKDYDLHTGNKGATGVIENPHKFYDGEMKKYFPFYYAAAGLIIAAMEETEKKNKTRKFSIAAVKRFIDMKHCNYQLRGVFKSQFSDMYCVCDGYRLLRLQNDIESLPHVELCSLDDSKLIIPSQENRKEEIQLPSIDDVKNFIRLNNCKRSKKEMNNAKPYELLPGDWHCNPFYLLDMLEALDSPKAYNPGSSCKPMYFEGVNGDGILMPVRIAKGGNNG